MHKISLSISPKQAEYIEDLIKNDAFTVINKNGNQQEKYVNHRNEDTIFLESDIYDLEINTNSIKFFKKSDSVPSN